MNGTGEFTVECCMRSLTPADVQTRQRQVLDRLEAVLADGLVAAVDLVWWSDKVCPPETAGPLASSCPPVVRDVLTLAETLDLDLEPYFGSHACVGTGDEDVLVLPVVALLVREGGTIVGLYPISHEGTRYTVEDCLERLEAGESPANLPSLVSTRG